MDHAVEPSRVFRAYGERQLVVVAAGNRFEACYGAHVMSLIFGGHANAAMSIPWLFLHARRTPGTLEKIGEEAVLEALLATDPQTRGHRATGWTVPLLQGELAERGTVVGERTIRRALHRLGYRWKRPRYVLGRPDPAYAEKKGR